MFSSKIRKKKIEIKWFLKSKKEIRFKKTTNVSDESQRNNTNSSLGNDNQTNAHFHLFPEKNIQINMNSPILCTFSAVIFLWIVFDWFWSWLNSHGFRFLFVKNIYTTMVTKFATFISILETTKNLHLNASGSWNLSISLHSLLFSIFILIFSWMSFFFALLLSLWDSLFHLYGCVFLLLLCPLSHLEAFVVSILLFFCRLLCLVFFSNLFIYLRFFFFSWNLST